MTNTSDMHDRVELRASTPAQQQSTRSRVRLPSVGEHLQKHPVSISLAVDTRRNEEVKSLLSRQCRRTNLRRYRPILQADPCDWVLVNGTGVYQVS